MVTQAEQDLKTAAETVEAVWHEGMLVVRLRGRTPRLWRAPQADVLAAQLTLDHVEAGGKNLHRLSFVGGDFSGGAAVVGEFDDKAAALRAFDAVSDVLMGGAGAPIGDTAQVLPPSPQRRPWLARAALALVKLFLWVLFILMVAFIALQLFFVRPLVPDATPGVTGTSSVPAGVPVPAGRVLGE